MKGRKSEAEDIRFSARGTYVVLAQWGSQWGTLGLLEAVKFVATVATGQRALGDAWCRINNVASFCAFLALNRALSVARTLCTLH